MGDRGVDPYYDWLGIRPSEQPADYYRLLGIARFEDNRQVIERAADRQMGYVRQFQAKHPGEVSQLLSHLSLARITLTDGKKRVSYDSVLRNQQAEVRSEKPTDKALTIEALGRAWYFQLFGVDQGPFTTAELQARIKAGEVCGDTLVRKGAGGRWMLAKDVNGLFDLPVVSPPPAGTVLPELPQLEPVAASADLLSGPMPEPEDRTPGPNVWVCRDCRWPVPKGKTNCPRCGYIKKVSEGRSMGQDVGVALLLVATFIVVLMIVCLLYG